MKKLYVDRIIDMDSDGGSFISESEFSKENHRLSFILKNEKLESVSILASDCCLSLKLTKEELLFIEEQLFIKKIEVDDTPLSIDRIIEIDKLYSPIIETVTFKIRFNEQSFPLNVHFKRGDLYCVTTPNYGTFNDENPIIELHLKEDKKKQIEKYLLNDKIKHSKV
ncbi:hypothetical protein ACQRXC_13350 [Niallia taxi]|uniref:hypothetical protein n=1 Tax=Niallia taxi TaxID=2499688 RepID=UPI003F5EABE6